METGVEVEVTAGDKPALVEDDQGSERLLTLPVSGFQTGVMPPCPPLPPRGGNSAIIEGNLTSEIRFHGSFGSICLTVDANSINYSKFDAKSDFCPSDCRRKQYISCPIEFTAPFIR